MLNTTKQVYFKGLNGLRFFAALAVIITHIELIKGAFGMKNVWKNPIIFNLGGLGVYFFFVLSGFLITYLLLAEKSQFNHINIKSFYLRRVLRIWPLYYLVLILGFFILPHFDYFKIPYLEKSFSDNFTQNLILYILILPNLAFSIFPAVPNIGQAWSIGVEEQFYIVWPWIISKSKNILKTLVVIIIVLIVIKFIILIIGFFYKTSAWYEPLKLFVAMSKFECMAIGGIGAYLVFTKHNLLNKISHSSNLLLSIIGIPLLIFYTPNLIQDGIHIIYSILFLIIIIHVSSNQKFQFLENRLFNYLGKISYGLYMYHFMIIPLVLSIYKKSLANYEGSYGNVIIYGLTICLTVFISALSYHFFENYFIKLKSKYTFVKSKD